MSKPPLHALNGIGDFGTTTRPQLVLLRIDPSSPLCLFTRFCFILLPVPDPDAQPLACFLFSSFSDMRGRPLTALWPAPFLVSPFFWSAVRSPSVTGRVTEYESAFSSQRFGSQNMPLAGSVIAAISLSMPVCPCPSFWSLHVLRPCSSVAALTFITPGYSEFWISPPPHLPFSFVIPSDVSFLFISQ